MTIREEQGTQAHLTARVVDIYCRVSGKTQEDNTSLKMQEAKGREFAAANGHIVGMVHVEVGSGFTLNRKKLKLMQERYRSGIIQGVIFYKVSRLARTQEFINYLMVEMKIYQCQVFCVHTPLNENDDDYQLRLFMETFFADRERKEIVTKLAEAKVASIQEGNYAILGKKPRYGYNWYYKKSEKGTNKKVGYKVDEEKAKNVRSMFNMFDEGKSLKAIRVHLQAVDKSLEWDERNIKRMLMDVRYTGKNATVFHTKRIGSDTHFDEMPIPDGTYPQIINEEQFNRIQERIRFYKLDKPSRNKNPKRFLLRIIVFCGICGRAMSAINKSKGRWVCESYTCRTSLDHSVYMSARILDREVWAYFEEIARDLPIIREHIERELKRNLESKEYEKIEEQRAEHKAAIARLEDDLLKGRVTEGARAFVYKQLEIQQNSLKILDDKEKDREKIKQEVAEKKKKYAKILSWYERIKAGIDGTPLDYDEKREFLTMVMGIKIIVYPCEKGPHKRWSIVPNEVNEGVYNKFLSAGRPVPENRFSPESR